MICPACGYANEDGVSFCEKCKADLEMPAASMSSAPGADVMADQVSTPAPAPSEEPIPLEPIALEPIEPIPSVSPESLAATNDSTADHPAIGSPPTSAPPLLPATIEPSGHDATTAATSTPLASPKLVVVRGQRMDVQYPLYPGKNYLGRTDDKPVDIDLEDQEAQDRIWTSRQHAVISFDDGKLTIEDLNSLNGTFVNRNRVHPGQLKALQPNDVIQVGTVHMKVVLG